METILKYLPYVLLFAVATMIVYGWGLWRASRQNQDLANMLSAKGISAVKKVLKKKGPLTRKELEPFVKDLTAKQPFMQDSIGVTDPKVPGLHSALYDQAENDPRGTSEWKDFL